MIFDKINMNAIHNNRHLLTFRILGIWLQFSVSSSTRCLWAWEKEKRLSWNMRIW